MTIREVQGDILVSEAQTIVCPTNCVGVMGKGLALAVKETYPTVERQYRRDYLNGRLTINTLPIYEAYPGRRVLCFPTKDHWRDPSRLEWVGTNLYRLAQKWYAWEITTLAIPPVGCGLGGLDWNDVKPLIYHYLDPLPLDIDLYTP